MNMVIIVSCLSIFIPVHGIASCFILAVMHFVFGDCKKYINLCFA